MLKPPFIMATNLCNCSLSCAVLLEPPEVCYTSAEGRNGPVGFQNMSFIVPENLKNAGKSRV